MGRIVAVFPALLGFALAWFIKHRESGANVGPNSMSTFKAAVVEYQPVVNAEGRHGRATDLIMRNLREYAKFVLQANQQGCDIVVFPEYGLMSAKPEEFVGNAAILPEGPFPIHADRIGADQKVLRSLSALARKHSVYIVANLITVETNVSSKGNGSEHIVKQYFNTALAFDRNGSILTRYRKLHLYGEPLSSPDTPDVATFRTDFGATVGLMICFDIMFEQPMASLISEGVDVIAYPTAWYDELPFLTAVQYHSGWAMANSVVLLAAGKHQPWLGSIGSGVYHLQHGILNYTCNSTSGSRLVTATVVLGSGPRKGLQAHPSPISSSPSEDASLPMRHFLQEDLSLYSWTSLRTTEESATVRLQHRDPESGSTVECQLGVETEIGQSIGNDDDDPLLLLVAYSGRRTFGKGTDAPVVAGVQVCGLLACRTSSDIDVCHGLTGYVPPEDTVTNYRFKKFVLQAKFEDEKVKAAPVHLAEDLQPFPNACVSFDSDASELSVSQREDFCRKNRVSSIGLYARLFALD